MKVLLAGGGTGGHINPAIAIADAIRQAYPHAEIAFIGTKRGLENKLIPAAGYPIYHIEMRGLQRRLTLANLKTAYYYFTAPHKAKKLLQRFAPDIVIGTGGYLCWPLLHAAAKLGIPTAVHESNAIPGKAVKMLEKEVDRIYTNFPSTAEYLTQKEKILCVGNPLISPPEQHKDATSASAMLSEKIPDGTRKILLSFGGSLGAERVNAEIIELMSRLGAKDPSVFHIHATGRSGYKEFCRLAEEKGLSRLPNIRYVEYLYDMPAWERAADVVICRAGAMTLSEMALLGRACIIIPSPNVVNNHQYENAKRLADAGAAIMLEEKYLTSEALYRSVAELLSNDRLRAEYSRKIGTFANSKTKEAILQDITLLVSGDVLSLLDRDKES